MLCILKTALLRSSASANNGGQDIYTTFEQFGANGVDNIDDSNSILKALQNKANIITGKKGSVYIINNILLIKSLRNKKILMNGCKILNTDTTKASLLFQDCVNLNITGGDFGYLNQPKSNGGNSQHVFQFNNCQNITLNEVHILNSPEMGIAITNSNKITIKNSKIENTFRDGTYAHYSSNVSYLHNTYTNIKDDAMSFHDYGVQVDKSSLKKNKYGQSTNFIATNNSVKNCYQGIASIGSRNLYIAHNTIHNTVLAGISVFNSLELYENGNAEAKDVLIENNYIEQSCTNNRINNITLNNNGQSSTGRAAIFVGSLGRNNQINMGESKRLHNVKILKNVVVNSGSNGFFGDYTDSLVFEDNKFYNCFHKSSSQHLDYTPVEINNVNNLYANNNTIIDNRSTKKHRHGYSLINLNGIQKNWNVKGVSNTKSFLRDINKPN
jgi:polygalacturonase